MQNVLGEKWKETCSLGIDWRTALSVTHVICNNSYKRYNVFDKFHEKYSTQALQSLPS
jgi:hypothetical protein